MVGAGSGVNVPDASMTDGGGASDSHARSRTVVVFGSSRSPEDSPACRQAYRLGRLLAQSGYVVCNGGYAGVMAAVARGAKEAGGRTVGITVAMFPERTANPWLDQVVHTQTIFARLEAFVSRADAFVVLKGGVGTLLECALIWNLAQAGALGGKPIILLGRHWPAFIRALVRHSFIRDEDQAVLHYAGSPNQVIQALAMKLAS